MASNVETSQPKQPIEIEVRDLTQSVPDSNLAAIIHFRSLERYVEVSKDGTVRLISAAGTVSARFKEAEKRDYLRQVYIQTLLASGIIGEELVQALAAIERVDRRLSDETNTKQAMEDLETRTQSHLNTWTEAQGIDRNTLTEEKWVKLAEQGISQVRKPKNT